MSRVVVGSAETANHRARRRGIVFRDGGRDGARAHLLDALAIPSVKRAPCATHVTPGVPRRGRGPPLAYNSGTRPFRATTARIS